jgi:hypothetical protein
MMQMGEQIHIHQICFLCSNQFRINSATEAHPGTADCSKTNRFGHRENSSPIVKLLGAKVFRTLFC